MTPTRRVVLLGASNLTRGISTVLNISHRLWGDSLDFMAALGHGRSYGSSVRVLGRRLPGIVDCALWDDLQRRPTLPTTSLVTDVGNDLLFGFSPEEIASWVRECLSRLSMFSEHVVVTSLPLPSVQRLSPAHFRIVKRLLFPRSKLTRQVLLERATRLDQLLVDCAREQAATVVQPDLDWYGIDPIHIKLRHWHRAWMKILHPWCDKANVERTRGSLVQWMRLRMLCPYQRYVFGFEQTQTQPARRQSNGTLISFY